MRRIIFRMDDISPDMNYDKFCRLKDLFIKNDITPLIGIIPNNKDESLIEARKNAVYVKDDDIWKEIKKLQDDYGWEIALHGHEHMYTSEEGGILKINKKSEFAGLPYDKQINAIKTGKEILEKKGFIISSFMAPAHSFDRNTIKALLNVGVCAVTDGKGVYPYEYSKCLLMPVPYSIYRNFPFGIYTVCLHSNTMSELDVIRLDEYIKKNKKNIISFSEGVRIYEKQRKARLVFWRFINIFVDSIMILGVKIAKVIGDLRHKK